MHRYLLHNDEIRETTDLVATPGQAGLMNGWGVFSTLRVIDGVLFAWPRHVARMQRDAARYAVPFPEPAWLEERLLKLVAANQAWNSTLRVVVVRNTGGPFDAPGQRPFDLIAFTKDLVQWGNSVKLGLLENGRFAASPFRGSKVLSWSENLRMYEMARQQGFDEVILLNERGEVAELTSANLFAVFGSQIVTPPLDAGCLPGVTRELLLEEIQIPGYRVAERPLTPADLEAADELFITSSTRDTLPVSAVDGLNVRFVAPAGGPARQAAQQAFAQYLQQYANSQRTLPVPA